MKLTNKSFLDESYKEIINESHQAFPTVIDLDNFLFILFASFASEEEAIALPLINALKELCEKSGKLDLFQVHMRMGVARQSPRRWDQHFYETNIRDLVGKNVNKIWMCGPPIMQEVFDRAAGNVYFHTQSE